MKITIPTRTELMNDPSVHTLTKDVLILTENMDVVDRYFDVLAVAETLKVEMDQAL